jgi:hypothetical protein
MDFVPILDNGRLLIECKVLSVLLPPKQLRRNLREAAVSAKLGWPLYFSEILGLDHPALI